MAPALMSKMKDCRVRACRMQHKRDKRSPLYRFARHQHASHNIVVRTLNGHLFGRVNKPLLRNGRKPR
ncbi:hypothetical protein SEA_GREKAYCON_68 [Arthrobacter phage Grekaycon]|uniref:Uncharacterized protein n=3 Tax=Marthavirus martha TaxID=1980950 RepID=A0A514A5L2_9CAUD|nr:hypothetical protein SEA_GREKAYCON_68 [Arthrobacter phage Grekaycon]